jgi:hypothetical protein
MTPLTKSSIGMRRLVCCNIDRDTGRSDYSMFAGAVLLAVIFMLLMPQTRNGLMSSLTWAGNWFVAWAPFSFIIVVVIFVVAPIASYFIIKSWPQTVEPENPMAKYRKADDVIVD